VSSDVAHLPDGGHVAFSVTGAVGAPPILLNRPLGGSMKLWGAFSDRLATAFHVVSFDPRGVGESSDVPLGHSTRAMARDAVQLLDHLGIESAHVFGLSLGGMVASFIALDFPSRVRSLVLASTIPEPNALSLRGLEKIGALARCFVRPGAAAEVALVHRILSREFRVTHPERVLEIERRVRATPARRRNLLLLALAAARHSARLDRLSATLPVLLLFGGLDVLAGTDARKELEEEIPNAVSEVVTGAGHDLTLEQPWSAAARILEFLAA
jgi:pimeloyl-ACP methyl ester carboxylesterase